MPYRRIALITIALLFPSFGLVASAAAGRSVEIPGPTPEPTATPEPSPTPSAEELRLQEEIRLLTLQKAKADLEKAFVRPLPRQP